MPSSAVPNSDPLDIARRIIELDSTVNRELEARRYEAGAAVRDKRVALERELEATGHDRIVQNMRTAIRGRLSVSPMIELLQAQDVTVDSSLLEILAPAPLPVRWVIHNLPVPCAGTLRQRLNAESLASPYYRAAFPVFASSTLSRATFPSEWFNAVVTESERSSTSVVWLIADLHWLAHIDIFEKIVGYLRNPASEFVACVDFEGQSLAERLIRLPGVWAVNA